MFAPICSGGGDKEKPNLLVLGSNSQLIRVSKALMDVWWHKDVQDICVNGWWRQLERPNSSSFERSRGKVCAQTLIAR